MSKKIKFSSKIGLVAATVGSAVGLGNVWRFPAEAQENGGAAFLFVYILCMLCLGVPVMIAEFSLGRGTRGDAEGAFRKMTPKKKWWITGCLALLASYIILSFYTVVAGWTLEYLWDSVTGSLYTIHDASPKVEEAMFQAKMSAFISDGFRPLTVTFIVIILNLAVLMAGVQKGIERMSNIMMPLLFALLLIFAAVSLSMPGAVKGLEYFLSPNFSKITWGVIVNALGQSFFSLSLGMGILITYSAYYPKSTKLTTTALTVSMLDLLVALLMGVIIFPAVASSGLDSSQLKGATLVFVTLPEIFASMEFTRLWSVLFFLLLLVAAITSTISVAEVTVAWIEDRFKRSRRTACLIVLLPLFVFSTICSLSFGVLGGVKIGGMIIFDFLDNLATNIMLPLVSILTCVYVGWVVKKDFLYKEITNNGANSKRIYPFIRFSIRYLAPPLILLILVASFIK